MIRPILKWPNPLLKTPCIHVMEFDEDLKRLASDLIFTLAKSRREGVGLAANQIGDLRRVFVIWQQGKEVAPTVFVNPVVRKARGEQTGIEGCLSLEESDDCKVTRAKIVDWTAQDLDGKKFKGKFTGFEARVFLHELEHLNGILITDHRKAGRC